MWASVYDVVCMYAYLPTLVHVYTCIVVGNLPLLLSTLFIEAGSSPNPELVCIARVTKFAAVTLLPSKLEMGYHAHPAIA